MRHCYFLSVLLSYSAAEQMSNIATVTVHNWAGITDDDGQVSITTKFTLEVGASTTTSLPERNKH